MSRTDKDRPYEVRVRDSLERTVEYHHHVFTWRHAGYHTGEQRCDYADWLTDKPHVLNDSGRRIYRNCYRALGYTRNYGYHVPGWYLDHHWNNPERVRVRDGLNQAKQWYNGGDDLEDFDFPNYQHHHRSSYYWD